MTALPCGKVRAELSPVLVLPSASSSPSSSGFSPPKHLSQPRKPGRGPSRDTGLKAKEKRRWSAVLSLIRFKSKNAVFCDQFITPKLGPNSASQAVDWFYQVIYFRPVALAAKQFRGHMKRTMVGFYCLCRQMKLFHSESAHWWKFYELVYS